MSTIVRKSYTVEKFVLILDRNAKLLKDEIKEKE